MHCSRAFARAAHESELLVLDMSGFLWSCDSVMKDFTSSDSTLILSKVTKLNRGESYIRHIAADRVQSLVNKKQFEATSDFSRLAEADCIIICVPTPLTAKKDPDLQYIESTADAITKTLRKGQIISLESTTYPGTTDEILLEKFRPTGLGVGQDYFLVFSPEREDPGNPKFSTRTIPKVVGGTTPDMSGGWRSALQSGH